MASVGTDTRPRFRHEALTQFMADVFERLGMPVGEALAGAEVLIDADLAGIESHGIAHLPWHGGYAPGLKDGRVVPKPTVTVLRESPVAATWDAGGGLGVLTARRAME